MSESRVRYRRQQEGFTLIELLVVIALMGLVIGGTFLIFTMGTRGFSQALSRTGSVGEIHALTRALERDVKMSHFYSVSTRARTASDQSRDGLCVTGLSDWGAPTNFEVGTGLPNWDRWIFYYATSEELGRLIRLEMERPSPFYPLSPYPDLISRMTDNPESTPRALKVTSFSKTLRSFKVETDPATRLVKIGLILFNPGSKQLVSEQRTEEYLESTIEISPLNSYPDL